MFCTSCGAHVPEEAQFCTNCGASLAGAAMGSDATAVVPGEQMDTAFSGNYANDAYQGDVPVTQGYGSSVPSFAAAHPVMDPTSDDIRRKLSETSSATMLPQPRKPASTKILLGVLAAGALALVAVFGFAVSGTGGGGGGTTPAYASGPKLAFVDFDMDSEDGLEGASEVPIAIEGKDYEGNPVATRVTYHPKQGPVAVRPGTYTARILASPVSQDGKLYRYPEKTYDLTIPESAAVTLNPSTGVASESGEDASADSSAGTDATSASDANAEGGETPDNAVSDQETPDGASFDSGEASTEGVEGDGIGSAQDLSSAEEYPSIVVGSDDPIVFEIRDDASEEEVAQANQVREEAQEQMAASDIVYNEEEALTILETHVDQEGQNASSSSSQHASPEQQSASSSNAASSSDPAPAAKVDKSNLFSAYLKIVKAYSEAQRSSSHKPETDIAPNSINDAVVSDASNLRYAFFDINGDGVEELLVGESSVTPFAFQIFTTSDVAAGTVVEVGRSQAKTPIVICENGVMAESAITMGGLTSTTYRRLPAHGSAWETIESIESDLSAKPTKNIRTDASGSTTDVTEAQAKEVRDTYKPQRCIGWKPVAGFNMASACPDSCMAMILRSLGVAVMARSAPATV
ncbi:MAG: zinc-ribbon domain-containing protein, partial [Eggerthellaceae bacterium]|nr:zinc-ribbon domain-containing protein [Eggerthellaceae bacterium]